MLRCAGRWLCQLPACCGISLNRAVPVLGVCLGQRWFGRQDCRQTLVQVNDAAGPQWEPRVQQLHEFWQQRLFHRDTDITPLMYVASLIPGVWHHAYLQQPAADA